MEEQALDNMAAGSALVDTSDSPLEVETDCTQSVEMPLHLHASADESNFVAFGLELSFLLVWIDVSGIEGS